MKQNVTLVMLVILMPGVTFSAQAQYRNQRPGQRNEFRQQERKQVSPENYRAMQSPGNQSPQQRWRERRFHAPRPANR